MKFLIAMIIIFGSVDAMAEKIELIVSNSDKAQSMDQIRYNVVIQLASNYKDTAIVVPMNLEVIKALSELSNGKYHCEGERYRGQIFSLENCQPLR